MADLRVSRRHVIKGIAAAGVLGALGQPTSAFVEASGPAAYIRWDIQSIDFSTTPPTQHPGGVASAFAEPDLKITLTGHGFFFAPANGGPSDAVTGGGTWKTFGAGGVSTGSGTYKVTGLASWQFANLQTTTPPFVDAIGEPNQRANGNAVLLIAYSDGSQGTLGLGCEGPGAPMGIQEGVIATKGYFTYWTREAPSPPSAKIDKDRTLFHIMR